MQPPRPATGVSRALRARSVPGVSLGVSLGPFGPRAPECPKSVPGVSRECSRSVRDTFLTLSGHFLDTPEPGAQRAPETPRDTPGTLRARRARETPVAGRGGCNALIRSKNVWCWAFELPELPSFFASRRSYTVQPNTVFPLVYRAFTAAIHSAKSRQFNPLGA